MQHSPVLILFAHPALDKSRVNAVLLDAIRDLPGVTIRDLYELYPDFDIDVRAEQRLLTDHEVIVFHHPFYWYSSPALLKEWQDLVLEHGWAYGRRGTALRGKLLCNAITTGGGEDTYCAGGHNCFTIRELLRPFEQTASLCGMTYLPPFVVYATHTLTSADITRHAADYRRVVEALRDRRIDTDAARALPRLHVDLAVGVSGGGA